MTGIDNVIAGTAFEIVARSFTSESGADRNSFRLKNLTRSEALEFLKVWQLRSAERKLGKVRLLVASDSHEAFPEEFRANPELSITYYRNNNEHGLVYIETKVESDEQGLKNIFTLRDVNFLDGTFDDDGFIVPDEMVRQAFQYVDMHDPDGNVLIRDRLVEVLKELARAGMTVPVRKFAGFVLAAAKEIYESGSTYSPNETDELVGRSLKLLDMFPDEHWREMAGRISRRLSLNLLRAELAASASADLDREKTAQDCLRTKFTDVNGEKYDPELQEFWRLACYGYCQAPSRDKRARIPYRIFEQVFTRDVKGLPLGQRIAEEIDANAPDRRAEFDELSLENGLNNRSADDARKLLECDPEDSGKLPLRDLLSKQTLRMVDKLASPSLERIRNPLIKLSQVASNFWARHDLNGSEFKITMRFGLPEFSRPLPTAGLFAFLYGGALEEVGRTLKDGLGSVSLELDPRMVAQYDVPPLKQDFGPSADDTEGSAADDDDGVVWLPLPLEFVLVNSKDGIEIDSETAIEWFPEDLPYLALFWISVCGEDRCDLNLEHFAQPNKTGAEWISEVVSRRRPFDGGAAKPIREEALGHPIIAQLIDLRSRFRNEVAKEGLLPELMNNFFDEWAPLLSDARTTFVPDGDVPDGMIEFMNADCVLNFDGDQVLMLQSHPLKLRWIAAYLLKCSQLAADAIEGSLKLNSQNENLYLDWIQGLSPHQQPSIHTAVDGHILFAAGEQGWTESFHRTVTSGGTTSGDRIHSSLVAEIVRQITLYLHAHPYKSDGLAVLVVTGGASALPADIVQGVRKAEFKNLAMTIEFVAPRKCWDEAARQFEMVDTDNRLAGDGVLFPPVQLNLHDLERVRDNADAALGDLVCDIAIVPQFLDDNVSTDAKTEDESTAFGKFNPLLDDPTYIASGADSSALWVSLRPKTSDIALSNWSTLAVRHERRNPVASDRPEATDFIDIRINFHNTARFFGVLHERSHWVITVERHITRKQIERLETRPEVLSLRDGVGPGGLFTMIVSSNAGKKFVIDRLTRKLSRIASLIGRSELADQHAQQLAQQIYSEARQISPRLTLDALGISRVTEEILGLSIARKVADSLAPISVSDGLVAWISLDEHPEWFGSANSMRADMVRLSLNLGDDGLSVDLLVLESKLRRSGYDAHGAEQVRKTLNMFDSVFPSTGELDSMDGELWRETILSAIDTISEDAVHIQSAEKSGSTTRRSRVSGEIRRRFREGDFVSLKITGLYSICEYSHHRELSVESYDADPRVQIAQTGGSALLDSSSIVMDVVPDGAKPTNEIVQGAAEDTGDDLDVKEAWKVERQNIPETDSHKKDIKGHADNVLETEISESNSSTSSHSHLGQDELHRRYQVILDTFGQYGINVSKAASGVEHAVEGPASILFRVKPGKGVSPSKLYGQHDALKLALELDAAQDIRFDIDKGYVTIDVPKLDEDRYFVSASGLWSRWSRPKTGLAVPIGEDRFGNVVEINFTSSNSPHLLIGGTTGSGKSEALNTILLGITEHYGPEEVRLQLIDPKGTELEHLSESEHLDGEVGWDEEDAKEILARAVEEMQERYAKFRGVKVRSLEDYNAQAPEKEKTPWWIIVLDEYADLTSEPDAKKIIEGHLKRLAQKARAAGIHVIIATQKPDATVISTNLRSNLPAQLALRVKSSTESRVIMDDSGAESLTGKGDAFFKESGVLTRVQCAKI
ncbi:FtsK/SpoIIIE domain-containing protein [Marinobacter sp. 1_MG-2023]|uniref:FtsK/SpoIIIE domain-containing protein n=1 Tax=Marinobacter sp. 1_MG-2023 TaxID=3062627 RepID=UPI0026E2F586|nr:FtsK/SpoIIIE domain-containing protein [Marinobacter sp. 1_MG-2023]MDO6824999.1 FtsK/SpoIIIE domain-containing protein [Marinobacter sp. 1_MG-2023]